MIALIKLFEMVHFHQNWERLASAIPKKDHTVQKRALSKKGPRYLNKKIPNFYKPLTDAHTGRNVPKSYLPFHRDLISTYGGITWAVGIGSQRILVYLVHVDHILPRFQNLRLKPHWNGSKITNMSTTDCGTTGVLECLKSTSAFQAF